MNTNNTNKNTNNFLPKTGFNKGRRGPQKFDLYDFQNKFLHNPVNMAKELTKNMGADNAFNLAKEIGTKVNDVFWLNVAHYLNKRLETPISKW